MLIRASPKFAQSELPHEQARRLFATVQNGIASRYRRSNHGAKQMYLTRGGRGHEALAAVGYLIVRVGITLDPADDQILSWRRRNIRMSASSGPLGPGW